LTEEMLAHNSRGTAWYNEKSVNKEKWSSGKILGKKTRLASWTEQSKTWLWLEQPQHTLALEITRFAVRDARLEFTLSMRGKAGFNVWGRIPKLVKGSASGTADVIFDIEGSTAFDKGGLGHSQITKLDGRFIDLKFNSDFGNAFEDLAKDALNDYLHDKNDKLRKSVEKAIDKVNF
jgi:hypothetical protein